MVWRNYNSHPYPRFKYSQFSWRKIGARVINFFTIGKLIPIFVFVACGLPHIETSSSNQIFSFEVGKVGTAIVIALFAYTGFEYMPVLAGEMKRPKRDIPIAFFLVILGTTLIYAFIQTVATGTLPGLAQSEKPLADAAASFLGPAGGILIAVGALLAIAGVNSGIALTGPRNLFALSADVLFPAVFSKIHPKFHTPYVAIGINTFLTLTLFLPLYFIRKKARSVKHRVYIIPDNNAEKLQISKTKKSYSEFDIDRVL